MNVSVGGLVGWDVMPAARQKDATPKGDRRGCQQNFSTLGNQQVSAISSPPLPESLSRSVSLTIPSCERCPQLMPRALSAFRCGPWLRVDGHGQGLRPRASVLPWIVSYAWCPSHRSMPHQSGPPLCRCIRIQSCAGWKQGSYAASSRASSAELASAPAAADPCRWW